jgi:hypothetical protein
MTWDSPGFRRAEELRDDLREELAGGGAGRRGVDLVDGGDDRAGRRVAREWRSAVTSRLSRTAPLSKNEPRVSPVTIAWNVGPSLLMLY